MSALPAAAVAAVRVLLVDDSAVVRGFLTRWLASEPDIEIAGVAINGRDAVERARKILPDVIILDVEMPELDGLSAIPQLLAAAPKARILMSSTLTRRNAEVTVKALAAGAADYVAKPEAGRLGSGPEFRSELIARVRALGPRRPGAAAAGVAPPPAPRLSPPVAPAPLDPGRRRPPAELILVGSSTGGPQALQTVLPPLAEKIAAPILVVQHMPAMFTTMLAEHLAKRTRGRACEASDGQVLEPGWIYVAPGDQHLRVTRRREGGFAAALDRGPPVNFCRPAVDPLFASGAEAAGAAVVAAVLTGMGHDGRAGAEAIVAKGGVVAVQDEATSIVWGMPGAVAAAGFACAVRPLDDMAATLLKLAQGAPR